MEQEQKTEGIAVKSLEALPLPLATFKVRSLMETVTFAVAVMAVPAILAHTPNNQWVVGTLTNALLILACFRIGIINALVIGALPSSIALLRGLLPAPMAILVPYIIIGNSAMLISFGILKFKSLVARITVASIIKFGIIFGSASLLVSVPGKIIQMMQWPQLVTALMGGLLAVGTIKMLRKKKDNA